MKSRIREYRIKIVFRIAKQESKIYFLYENKKYRKFFHDTEIYKYSNVAIECCMKRNF